MKKLYKSLICLGIAAVSGGLAALAHLIFAKTGLSQSTGPAIIFFFIFYTLFAGIISKHIPDSAFLHFFYFPDWQLRNKILIISLLVVFAAATVLCAYKPSEDEMIGLASDEVRAEIKADESRDRKRITTTYQSMYFINYVSFSSSSGDLNEKYIGIADHSFSADDGFTGVVGDLVNYTYRMMGCQKSVLYGVKLTLFLTALSVSCGFILSIFLALGKISKFKLLSKVCGAYIFFFRGTPLLIQLFCVYLAIPGLLGSGFNWKDLALTIFPQSGADAVYWGAFIAAFIAFTLNSAAYCSEIVRAAIQSIDKGQHEAAKALGFTYGQTMSKIIIPQSLGRLVPPIANEFIMVLKDASLVFAISLQDITTISKNIATTEASFMVFIPALVIFLIITATLTFIFNKLEKQFSKYF